MYGIGLALASGLIMTEMGLSIGLWLVPMLWEIVVFGMDRLVRRQT
jgi:hypothetical protein